MPGQTGPAGIESGNDDRITLDDAARLLFVLRRHAVELLAPDRNGPADGARQPSSVFRADVLRCRDGLRARQQAALAELVRTSEVLRLYDAKPGTPPEPGR